MTFTLQDWHLRFSQQACWTARLREYLLGQMNLTPTDCILETGCGTGVITQDIASRTKASTYGLDLDLDRLQFARDHDPSSQYFCSDGLVLPIVDDAFSLVFCHFYLLWIKDPKQAIKEMIRVTHPGGIIAFFAEPDHTSRIDYPDNFIPIGKLQTRSLEEQGADPQAGRKLIDLLKIPEAEIIEFGLLQWLRTKESFEDAQMEWQVVKEDLRSYLKPEELETYSIQERTAWTQGNRIRYVPTFYAMARVKK